MFIPGLKREKKEPGRLGYEANYALNRIFKRADNALEIAGQKYTKKYITDPDLPIEVQQSRIPVDNWPDQNNPYIRNSVWNVRTGINLGGLHIDQMAPKDEERGEYFVCKENYSGPDIFLYNEQTRTLSVYPTKEDVINEIRTAEPDIYRDDILKAIVHHVRYDTHPCPAASAGKSRDRITDYLGLMAREILVEEGLGEELY